MCLIIAGILGCVHINYEDQLFESRSGFDNRKSTLECYVLIISSPVEYFISTERVKPWMT